jgi:hypothetical protein
MTDTPATPQNGPEDPIFIPLGRPPSRWGLFAPFILLMLVFVGIAAFWFVASRGAGGALDSWIEREKAVGRHWTCPERSIGGFPFRVEVSCVNPTFSAQDGTSPLESGSLGRILALTQTYQPDLVIVEASGPLTLKERGGPRLNLSWTTLRMSLRGRPGDALIQFALEAKDIAVQGKTMTEEVNAAASKLEVYLRRNPDAFETEKAYDLSAKLTGVTIPALDPAFGAEPGLAEIGALITHAAPFAARPLPSELERWRSDGGRIRLTTLMLAKGNQRLEATADLGLDAEHRIEGRAEVGLRGFDKILKNAGLRPEMTALLGIRPGQSGQITRFPLKVGKGVVSLGPLTLVALKPLY